MEAAAWIAKLSRPRITTAELHEFSVWRADPANDAAYRAVEQTVRRRDGRFVVQPDPTGFSVIDTWTGDPAVFAAIPQAGISEEDARDIAELLNRRAIRTDRSGMQ
jgi:hypothetical protein